MATQGEQGDGSVLRIRDALEAAGYAVFTGEQTQAGTAVWPSLVTNALRRCAAFVAVCSEEYGVHGSWSFKARRCRSMRTKRKHTHCRRRSPRLIDEHTHACMHARKHTPRTACTLTRS